MNPADSYDALPHEIQHSTLLQLLSNSLILSHTAPYLPIAGVLSLAATSRAFRHLIYDTPQVFRRLDLSCCKAARFEIDGIDRGGEIWRNVQVDEHLTEDEFYSGPLRGIFSHLGRRRILRNVQVLVLDGLSVTAELVHEILTDSAYSVRILSLRGCQHLNERQLRGSLQYACRSSRPEGSPRLKGVYIFGESEPAVLRQRPLDLSSPQRSGAPPPPAQFPLGTAWNTRSQQALAESDISPDREPDLWYGRRGLQFHDPRPLDPGWAEALIACDGVIAFDAVLCAGPRHLNSRAWGTVSLGPYESPGRGPMFGAPWSVATYSLDGCSGCGSAPEGWTVWGEERPSSADRSADDERRASSGSGSGTSCEIGRFPLIRHAPLHSANIRVAMCPSGQPLSPRRIDLGSNQTEPARFIPRCADCLRERYCLACHRWWCESCYTGPSGHHHGSAVAMSAENTGAAGGGGNAADGPSPGAPTRGGPIFKSRVSRSCYECGMNCHDCIGHTQRMCRTCGGGYCMIHNEGSNHSHCDWCSKRGRSIRHVH